MDGTATATIQKICWAEGLRQRFYRSVRITAGVQAGALESSGGCSVEMFTALLVCRGNKKTQQRIVCAAAVEI
jgi:hypothetical protein